MDEFESLNHTKWECKYHVVFIPKRPKKALFGQVRQGLGEFSHHLAKQKESRILEGHMQPDDVHMPISIPPKYAVSQVIGFHQGQERHSLGASLRRTPTQFHGRALLGARLFRLEGRSRRGHDTQVYTAPRKRGRARLDQMNLFR
jgi:putative transposase